MSIISIIPLVMMIVCVIFIGAMTKHIPWASVAVYTLIVAVTFSFSAFLWRHWAVNLFVFCPIAFVLAWLGVLVDVRRRK